MTKVAPCGQRDGRTGRYEDVNSRFSQLCECARNPNYIAGRPPESYIIRSHCSPTLAMFCNDVHPCVLHAYGGHEISCGICQILVFEQDVHE